MQIKKLPLGEINQNINFCMNFQVRVNSANILPDYMRHLRHYNLQMVYICKNKNGSI